MNFCKLQVIPLRLETQFRYCQFGLSSFLDIASISQHYKVAFAAIYNRITGAETFKEGIR